MITKKPAVKKTKETGVWVLTIDYHWGLRGLRKNGVFYFRSEPSIDKVNTLTGGHHYSLVRFGCSKEYASSSYH